jgi:hypothetical protein
VTGAGEDDDRPVLAALLWSSGTRRWYFGHTGGISGYVTFAAGTRDAGRLVVVAVNGVDPYVMEELMGRYLDDLLCRS